MFAVQLCNVTDRFLWSKVPNKINIIIKVKALY